MADFVVVVGAVALVLVFTVVTFISRFLLICEPNEVIVLSGRRRRMPDGSEVGYRVIRGGRALRIPIMERASRLSLETMPLTLTVQNAYSAGGIPLKVDAIANVKIASAEPILGNAVERFLEKGMNEIHQIAKETLEGNLRGVLATLTPEEVNEDRLKFAESLIEEADQDLGALGLKLDTLKIQNVSDDAGYLDSIGRRKTAEARRAALEAVTLMRAVVAQLPDDADALAALFFSLHALADVMTVVQPAEAVATTPSRMVTAAAPPGTSPTNLLSAAWSREVPSSVVASAAAPGTNESRPHRLLQNSDTSYVRLLIQIRISSS